MPLTGSNGPMWVRNVGGGGFGDFIIGSLVLPALIDVADPVGLTDARMSTLSMDAAGRLRCLVTGAAGAVFTVAPRGIQSVSGATGRVVAPGAGGAIVTIAAGSLAAGTYDVQVFAAYDAGAPIAAEINNMEFRRGAGVVTALQVLAILNVYGPARLFRMVMDGATALSVNATGAGTAGVGYNAELIATQVV